MSTSRSNRTVAFASDDFEQAVGDIPEALQSGDGRTFLFVGASEEQKQDAVAKLASPGELNLHSFKVPNLVGERLTETQGNLRGAFDQASEQAAILFFDEADILLDRSHDERGGAPAATEEERKAEQLEDQESEALSDYFFDRMEAFSGVTVVCFSKPSYVSRLSGRSPDVIVEF